MTKVAVGVPVRNGERYLALALESLLAQTHEDLEVVISDNGSTDSTADICRALAARDPRVRYVRQDVNRGLAFNHNFVLSATRAPYFRWLGYDDLLDPRCIEECAKVLDGRPDVVLAWPGTWVIDDEGAVSRAYPDDFPWDDRTPSSRLRSLLGHRTEDTLLHMCYPMYGLIRREALLATHQMGAYPAADTTLLVELAMRGRWQQVPERLFYNRRHEASSMIGTTTEQVAAYYDPRAGSRFPMPQTRLGWSYVKAVSTTGMPAPERLRCYAVVFGWLVRGPQPRIIAGELRIRARQWAAGLRRLRADGTV